MKRPTGFLLGAALAVSTAAERPSVNEQYVLGPDASPQVGVPAGRILHFTMEDSKVYPGFCHELWLFIPPNYDGTSVLPVMVFQDGHNFVRRDGLWRVPVVLENLIAKKQLPPMAAIFVRPGDRPAAAGSAPRLRPDGRPAPAENRSVEYDTVSDAYARFLLEEVFPLVRKHIVITDNPAGRGICGNSSGGICAFTVAWHRPDQFRKVYSTSGSFTNIRGGQAYPELVRRETKRPIRFFQQDGANDVVNKFGSWPEANRALAAALQEKGYDHHFVQGEGEHNSRHGASLLPYALRWLWFDYPHP